MSAIEAGDLVRRVWGCCAHTRRRIGEVFTVLEVKTTTSSGCDECGWYPKVMTVAVETRLPNECFQVAPVSWLIKVPPPAEPVSTKVADEEHA